MGLGEIGSRVRSLYDVNAFCLRVLRPQNGPLVGVSAVGVVGGLIYLGVDIRSGAWIAVVVGAFGAVDTVFSLAQRFMSPRKKLEPDDRTDSLLSQLTVRDDYADSGYAVTFLPGESVQAVVRSPNVDASLRDPRTDFPLRVNEELRARLDTKLQSHAQPFEDAIRLRHRQSRRADPPKYFFNAPKVGLGSDLLLNTQTLEIYEGSYFHSFVTNELVTTSVWDAGSSHPQQLYRGSEQFPAIVDANGKVTLKQLSNAQMGNHIGASTIAHTEDRQLVVWRQTPRAQQNQGASQGQLVPTGSGACEWADWLAQSHTPSLKGLITHTMTREFREESLDKIVPGARREDAEIETRILGHFLWLRRGGKPEFVGLTRVSYTAGTHRPDPSEVDKPPDLEAYPAHSVSAMHSSIERILELGPAQIAVPLWVTLTCLREALTADPGGWADFLGIENR